MLEMANFEGKAWLDRGFLWNDHAVAARARTLADFWHMYRRRQDRRRLPSLCGDSPPAQASFLPSHFTFATNHGVIQNIALWQLCIAFTGLN
jgi:hypothetical protein